MNFGTAVACASIKAESSSSLLPSLTRHRHPLCRYRLTGRLNPDVSCDCTAYLVIGIAAMESNGSNAANRVFDIAEVAEWVLVNLPTKDIAKACRVSNSFNNVVQTSPRLQQKLYLKPVLQSPVLIWKKEIECYCSAEGAVMFPISTLNPMFVGVEWAMLAPKHALNFMFDAQHLLKFVKGNPSWEQMFVTEPPATKVQIGHVA